MSKRNAVDKEYLLNQLKNYDSQIAEEKYALKSEVDGSGSNILIEDGHVYATNSHHPHTKLVIDEEASAVFAVMN